MSFQITYETVAVMKNLSVLIEKTIEELYKADYEVIQCYGQVKNTVGPHSKQIEGIVRDIEKLLKKYSEDINAVSTGLLNLSNRCQIILDKKMFKDSLKVSVKPIDVTSISNSGYLPSGAPVKGQRERQKGKQSEYEL